MGTQVINYRRDRMVGNLAIAIGIAGALAFFFLLAPATFAIATPDGSFPRGGFSLSTTAHYCGPSCAVIQALGGFGLLLSKRWGTWLVQLGSLGVIVCCVCTSAGLVLSTLFLNDLRHLSDASGTPYWLLTAWRWQTTTLVAALIAAIALAFFLPTGEVSVPTKQQDASA